LTVGHADGLSGHRNLAEKDEAFCAPVSSSR
jgi:hypothetical protein